MEQKKEKKLARPALGRGLSALVSAQPAVPLEPPSTSEASTEERVVPINKTAAEYLKQESASEGDEGVRYLDIESIGNNPSQPRQTFVQAELEELAGSIKTLGVLQPILVRPVAQGRYEIVAGERRWRASQLAGLNKVPAIIRELADKEALGIAIVENVQRSNLNPVEEARAYHRLATDFQMSQQEIAEQVGKDRTSVANIMRLLKLSEPVLEMLQEGRLSTGHAKVILSIKDPAAQLSLARKVINDGLSVRELEGLVAKAVVLDAGKPLPSQAQGSATGSAEPAGPFPDVMERMRRALGTKVLVHHHNSGRGKLVIEYFSEQELDRLVEQICH